MVRFVSDSGCDMFELEGASFGTAAITIRTEDESFTDDENLSTHRMIEFFLRHKGRSFTACPSSGDWIDAFHNDDGSVPEEVYVVTLTGGLSGTYNSACVAADIFMEEHPGVKVLVVDSLTIGPEMQLLLEKLVEMKRMGLSFEQVCEGIKTYQKHTRTFYALKSFRNLVENGRVSKLMATAAGALGLSVLGTATDQGTLENWGKGRGDRAIAANIMKYMDKVGYTGGRVRISHCENEELADRVRSAIGESFPKAEVIIRPVRGVCSFYAEKGAVIVGLETA